MSEVFCCCSVSFLLSFFPPEQLVIEEYERSLQFDEECLNAILDGLDASNRIICPVCRK